MPLTNVNDLDLGTSSFELPLEYDNYELLLIGNDLYIYAYIIIIHDKWREWYESIYKKNINTPALSEP
jgi:hypothetical protein